MSKINRQYILYALCAMSLFALILPLFVVEGKYGSEVFFSETVNGFTALGVSFLTYILIIAPICLAVLDKITALEKYNKILSILIPLTCILSLGLVYIMTKAYFEESYGYDISVVVSIGAGAIIAGISYIACAILGIVNNSGLKMDNIKVSELKDKIDVSQIKSVVGESGEILKLKANILSEEKNKENITTEIGRKYLIVHSDSNEEEFKELVIAAKEIDQKINDYRKQIQKIKGIKICPHCGEELTANSSFCNNCGAVVSKDNSDLIKCQNCGNMISKDKKFCAYCGTKVEIPEVKQIVNKAVCPNCGSRIEEGVMFCCECGAKLNSDSEMKIAEPEIKKCPGCGAVVNDELAFCMECGTKLQ